MHRLFAAKTCAKVASSVTPLLRSRGTTMKSCIVGHITHDLYPDGIYAGGCSFYGGMVHKALGAEVVLKAGVGLNFQCDAEIEVLNPILRRIGETTTFKNEYPENAPRVQWVESLAEPLPAELEEDFDLIH